MLGGSKVECASRGNALTTRCLSLRDRLAVDDEMIFTDVVFKDIKGGGKIRTAPELRIRVIKPLPEEGD